MSIIDYIPSMKFIAAAPTNYSSRRNSNIDTLVIHVAEATLSSMTNWFRNPAAKASAHFGIDFDGTVVKYLDEANNAWHCGNGDYNRRSIGIELTGKIGKDTPPGLVPFKPLQMRSLTRLCQYLCAQYAIPIDRNHIIGHNEVPDPLHAGKFGGVNHHGDPGPNFPWPEFMASLVVVNVA